MPEITHDPATWPTGDKLWCVARAVAHANAAHVQGSVADINNNPALFADGRDELVRRFLAAPKPILYPDKATGWNILRNALYRVSMGVMPTYTLGMTWSQWAYQWNGADPLWLSNVTVQIDVNPSSPLKDYFQDACH